LGKKAAKAGWQVQYAKEVSVKTELPTNVRDFASQDLRWKRALFRWFLRTDQSSLPNRSNTLVPYALSSFICLLLLSSGLLAALQIAEMEAFLLAMIVLLWNVARNSSPAAEVAVYERNSKWLKLLSHKALLHLIDLFITFYAILTHRRVSRFFKGTRTPR